MKRTSYLFILFLAIVSCNQTITNKDLAKLNGYWEIEKVIKPDGTKKIYKISETIDYFELKNNTGFRKKVTPQLDGSYLINNQFENISISENKNLFFIQYKTKYTTFKEQIVEIKDSTLILKNDQNVEYYYKKPIPFSIK